MNCHSVHVTLVQVQREQLSWVELLCSTSPVPLNTRGFTLQVHGTCTQHFSFPLIPPSFPLIPHPFLARSFSFFVHSFSCLAHCSPFFLRYFSFRLIPGPLCLIQTHKVVSDKETQMGLNQMNVDLLRWDPKPSLFAQ